MAVSVIITSPKPNNGRVRVMQQTMDSSGAPMGDLVTVGSLDDNETLVAKVDAHTVILLLEEPRGTAAAAAPGAPAPTEEPVPEPHAIPVIGGTQQVG